MATVQDMDDDGVVPMTDAEHLDLVAKGVTYSKMTPAQQRSWTKKARAVTKRLAAEDLALYRKHFGEPEHRDPPKSAKEMLERLRPKYKKGSEMDLLFNAAAKCESVVESVRRVRDPCY